MFDSENFQPLSPAHFFQIEADCKRKKGALSAKNEKAYRLPDSTFITQEETFCDVSMAWAPTGLEFFLQFHIPFTRSCYPNLDQGDAVELFIDTRDLKTTGFQTRFCHHFYFLPTDDEGDQAGEISRFRTDEESHELCDPKLLQVKAQFQRKSYSLNLWIPKEALFGYSPEDFDRLGFTYRIHRTNSPPQHFSCLSDEYNIPTQPYLWARLKLTS